MVTQLVSF